MAAIFKMAEKWSILNTQNFSYDIYVLKFFVSSWWIKCSKYVLTIITKQI
jgi:hypothetical protein